MSSSPRNHNTILAATLASAWLCGGLASISFLAVPAISQSPSTSILVKQFRKMYQVGRTTQPPATLLISLIWFFSAYQAYSAKMRGQWKVLSGAGGCLLGMLGFTYVVLEPTSHALMDMMHYHEIERNDGQDEKVLLRRWGSLNAFRAAMAAVAVGVGGWVLME